MAIRDLFKVNRKTFFNPSAWIDYTTLKQNTAMMYGVIKTLFTPASPTRRETFAEAMQRFKLEEKDIDAMATDYRVYAGVLFLLGLTGIGYCVYLLVKHSQWLGFVMGLCVTTLFFAQAFRYDFWAFQLQQRRLGCTFKEWQNHWLGNKKEPK